MKKIHFFAPVALLGFIVLISSCSKEELPLEPIEVITTDDQAMMSKTDREYDPTSDYSLTFLDPSIDPLSRPLTIFGVTIEMELWDKKGRGGRESEDCRYFGLCGGITLSRMTSGDVNNDIQHGRLANYVGRSIRVGITKSNLDKGELVLFHTKFVTLNKEDATFRIHEDTPIEGTVYYLKKGEYLLNENLGSFGGYQIQIGKY